MRERERDRQRERQRESERDTERERDRERDRERERETAKCCKRASVVQQSHQVFLVLTAEVGDLHPDFVAGLLSTTRIRKANKKVYYY